MGSLVFLGLAISFAGFGLFAWRSVVRWIAYPMFLMAAIALFFCFRPLFVVATN